MYNRSRLIVCLMSLIVSGTGYAQAQQEVRQFEIRVGYGYTDNALRDDLNKIDSEFALVGVTVDWNVIRPRYELSLLGDVDYFSTSGSQVRDRPEGDFNANLIVQLVPDRLNWYVSNAFSQIRQDISLGNTPANLNEVNVLSSGFTADLPLGSRTSLTLNAGASDRQVDFLNGLDSRELSAGMGLMRQISSRRRLGMFANFRNIVYDDAFDTEFDIESVAIRYESQLLSGNVSVDVGANRLNDKSQPTSGDVEPLVNIIWTRSFGVRTQLELSMRHRISELGGAIAAGGPGQVGIPTGGQTVATSTPFRDTSIGALLSISWARVDFNGGLLFSQQVFDSGVIEDANTIGLNLSVVRNLSNTLSLRLDGVFARRELTRSGEESDDYSAGISLRKVIGRRFSISGGYGLNARSSDIGQDFTENVYRIDFAYLIRR